MLNQERKQNIKKEAVLRESKIQPRLFIHIIFII